MNSCNFAIHVTTEQIYDMLLIKYLDLGNIPPSIRIYNNAYKSVKRVFQCIDLLGVSSHLIKPGGVRRGCAQVIVRVTPLGGQEAIKMVGNCCALGGVNCVGKPPGTMICHFPAFPDSWQQE